MLTYGPVYIHRFKGEFRCVWTPMGRGNTISIHGIGLAELPTIAIVKAVSHARQLGWVETQGAI